MQKSPIIYSNLVHRISQWRIKLARFHPKDFGKSGNRITQYRLQSCGTHFCESPGYPLRLRASRLVSKCVTMGATQDKMIIKKSGVSMILDVIKCQNKIMMFYLKENRYALEVQEALVNLSEQKKDISNEKEE